MTRQRKRAYPMSFKRAKYLIGGTMIASALLIGTSIEASAHTGTVKVTQDCHTWQAVVELNHNVTPDRAVYVTSTIPGTVGINNGHYTTADGEIWGNIGTAVTHGTVTLYVFKPKPGGGWTLEFTESKSLPTPHGCTQPTTTTVAPKPPQAITTVTCTSITVDPDPTFGVRFQGTIGGVTVDLAGHHVPGTHDSTADDTAYTGATGTIHYSITPLWTIPPNPYGIGSGLGVHVEGDLYCHEETTSTTLPGTTSTTLDRPSETTSTTSVPCSEPRGCCLAQCDGPTPKRIVKLGTPTSIAAPPTDALPRTGNSTVPLAAGGFGALIAGSAALALARKRKAA